MCHTQVEIGVGLSRKVAQEFGLRLTFWLTPDACGMRQGHFGMSACRFGLGEVTQRGLMGSMRYPQTTSVSGPAQTRASQVGQFMRTRRSGRGAGGANTAGFSASSGIAIVSAGAGALATARPWWASISCTWASDSGSVGHAGRTRAVRTRWPAGPSRLGRRARRARYSA